MWPKSGPKQFRYVGTLSDTRYLKKAKICMKVLGETCEPEINPVCFFPYIPGCTWRHHLSCLTGAADPSENDSVSPEAAPAPVAPPVAPAAPSPPAETLSVSREAARSFLSGWRRLWHTHSKSGLIFLILHLFLQRCLSGMCLTSGSSRDI